MSCSDLEIIGFDIGERILINNTLLRETREGKRKWIKKNDQGLPRLKQTGMSLEK